MTDEKMMCNCGHGHGSKKYMLFGTLAIVYGVVNYMQTVMGWQPYMAWIAGGAILILIAWTKGSMKS